MSKRRLAAGPPPISSAPRPKLAFGPGTIGAVGLVIALLLTGQLPRQDTPPPAAGWRSPRAVRPDPATPTVAPEPIAPEPVWLERQADVVGLDAGQRARLAAIVNDWRSATAADREVLGAAAGDLGRRLDTGANGHPERLLAASGGDYEARSGRLAAARQAAWVACLDLLTDAQRATVHRLRAAAPQEMR